MSSQPTGALRVPNEKKLKILNKQLFAAVDKGDAAEVNRLLECLPENRPFVNARDGVQVVLPNPYLKQVPHQKPKKDADFEAQIAPADIQQLTDPAHSYTPLHVATQRGDIACMTALINHGANVNARNPYQRTPLHLAIYKKNDKAVNLLLGAGAGVKAHDYEHFSVIDLARKTGQSKLGKYLHQILIGAADRPEAYTVGIDSEMRDANLAYLEQLGHQRLVSRAKPAESAAEPAGAPAAVVEVGGLQISSGKIAAAAETGGGRGRAGSKTKPERKPTRLADEPPPPVEE